MPFEPLRWLLVRGETETVWFTKAGITLVDIKTGDVLRLMTQEELSQDEDPLLRHAWGVLRHMKGR